MSSSENKEPTSEGSPEISKEKDSVLESAQTDDVLLSSKLNKKKHTLREEDEDYEPIDASPVDYKSNDSTKLESVKTDTPAISVAPSYWDHPLKKKRVIKKTFKTSARRREDGGLEGETTVTEVEPSIPSESSEDPSLGSSGDSTEKSGPIVTNEPVRHQSPPERQSLPPSSNQHRPSWMPEEVFQRQQESLRQTLQLNNQQRWREDSRDNYNGSSRGYQGNNHNNYNNYNNNSNNNRDYSENFQSDQMVGLTQEQKDEIIRNKYNQQAHFSRRHKRKESKIYTLRSFNNCIKYILVNKYGKPHGNVLDLGCGKGGDMAKWESIGTESYVGIDLSDQSIKEAISRYRKSRYQFHAIFATGDAFNVPIPKLLENFKEEVNLEFDTVSMQFCLHYAFDSEETIRHLLENISRSLKVGGMFIGTIPSSDFINWKLKKLPPGEKKWGNSIYSVEFHKDPPRDGKFPDPFGNMYTYYLVDAVDNVPEFVVPFEKLRSLCESYNLELRYKKNFFELFNKEIPTYFKKFPIPLIESLRKPDGTYGVSGEDRDACSFYLAFAFEKTGY